MSLTSTLASIAWGLFFARIVFVHLSGDLLPFGEQLTKLVGWDMQLIKVVYTVGSASTLAVFVFAVGRLLPAAVEFKQLQGPIDPNLYLKKFTAALFYCIFLLLCVLILSVGTGILIAGWLVFDTHDQSNGYHIFMAALLFAIYFIQLIREASEM